MRYPSVPFYIQTGNPEVSEEDTNKLVSDLLWDYESLIEKVSQREDLNNVRVLPQLHTLVWGNKRGV